jgi:hypothetical protein
MSNNQGFTPLMYQSIIKNFELDLNTIMIMCEADETIVQEKCQDPDYEQMLPLNFLLHIRTLGFLTVEADYFRYVLRLYPAAAGIKNGADKSPYDMAIAKNMDVYFVRLLLNADPTIDLERRRHLDFEARKDAILLAYRAISRDKKASIWKKLRALYGGSEYPTLLVHVTSYL